MTGKIVLGRFENVSALGGIAVDYFPFAAIGFSAVRPDPSVNARSFIVLNMLFLSAAISTGPRSAMIWHRLFSRIWHLKGPRRHRCLQDGWRGVGVGIEPNLGPARWLLPRSTMSFSHTKALP